MSQSKRNEWSRTQTVIPISRHLLSFRPNWIQLAWEHEADLKSTEVYLSLLKITQCDLLRRHFLHTRTWNTGWDKQEVTHCPTSHCHLLSRSSSATLCFLWMSITNTLGGSIYITRKILPEERDGGKERGREGERFTLQMMRYRILFKMWGLAVKLHLSNQETWCYNGPNGL